MAKKHRKKTTFNIAGYIAIFAVVALIALVTWIRGISLQNKIDGYAVRQQELESMIAAEEERTEKLEERKKYVQTKQYIEEVAREKGGLVYEDEIMFKPNTDK